MHMITVRPAPDARVRNTDVPSMPVMADEWITVVWSAHWQALIDEGSVLVQSAE